MFFLQAELFESQSKVMLGQCVSLGGTLRSQASSLGARRILKRPSSLSHHRHRSSSRSSRLQRRQQREPESVTPVAIIGAGPAGLALSALLSKFGVPSILLERSPALPTHPQAHFINLRSMEIMRHAFGGLDRRVLEMCPPQEEWRYGYVYRQCCTIVEEARRFFPSCPTHAPYLLYVTAVLRSTYNSRLAVFYSSSHMGNVCCYLIFFSLALSLYDVGFFRALSWASC